MARAPRLLVPALGGVYRALAPAPQPLIQAVAIVIDEWHCGPWSINGVGGREV